MIGYNKKTTPQKQELLKSILKYHLQITKNTIDKTSSYSDPTYHFIDANAGSGAYNKMLGSPLVFLDCAESLVWSTSDYKATFIEIENKYFSLLKVCLRKTQNLCYGSYDIINGNNRDFVFTLSPEDDERTYGLLYVDPNGIPDFDMICHFAKLYPTREILIRVPASDIKRNYYNHGKKLFDFLEQVKKCGKRYWLVSRIDNSDTHQAALLLGSSSDIFKTYKKIGLYKLGSPEADEIFDILNLTRKELELKQLGLLI